MKAGSVLLLECGKVVLNAKLAVSLLTNMIEFYSGG